MEASNDNDGGTVQDLLDEIKRKREYIAKRISQKDWRPLTFEDKRRIKACLETYDRVENNMLNRVYGINQKPKKTVDPHKLKTFQNLKYRLNSEQ